MITYTHELCRQVQGDDVSFLVSNYYLVYFFPGEGSFPLCFKGDEKLGGGKPLAHEDWALQNVYLI